MGRISLGFLIPCLLYNIQLASAQDLTPEPLTITQTFSATVALWTASTTTTASPTGHTGIAGSYEGLSRDSVGYSMAYVIDLAESKANPICFFPTSGTWSLLPRIVFYMTIVFALVARTRKWLIGGALAAGMTYSSLAALQVTFQVWTQQAIGEMDIIAMTGILSCSCLMVVPLMNWSSTIRNLGLSKQDKDKGKRHGAAYTVLILWGLLVTTGFLSAFVGLQAYFNDASWISIGLVLNGTNGPQDVTCVPSSGYLNTSAGQLPGWDYFWMTADFVAINNCRNPCEDVSQVNTLFRSAGELNLFGTNTIDLLFERAHVTTRRIKDLHFAQNYFQFLLFALPVIILQGVMHIVLFRRSSPQIARWKIYKCIAPSQQEEIYQIGSNMDKKQTRHKRKASMRKGLAMTLALAFYFFALLVLIVAPAGFIVTGVATEIASRFVRESETRNHVDQWGVFAALLMTLVAALVCHFDSALWRLYDEKLRAKIKNRNSDREQSDGVDGSTYPLEKRSTHRHNIARHIWHILHELKYHAEIFYCTLAFEWYQLKEFWLYPRTEPSLRHDDSNKALWVPVKPGETRENSQGTRRKIKQAFQNLKDRKEESADQFNLPIMRNTSRTSEVLDATRNHQRPGLVRHFSSSNSSYPLLSRSTNYNPQQDRHASVIDKPLPVEPQSGRMNTNVEGGPASNIPREPRSHFATHPAKTF